MQPSVAVVILNWNGKNYLQQFLPVLLSSLNGANAEVVVADNASTDDSVDFLRAQFPAVKLILLAENYGFARGYNEALARVQSDYYVLLNSDVEVTPGWLPPLIELLESDPSIAACQPVIKMFTDKSRFEYAGAAGGWIDSLGYPFARGRVFDYCEEDKGQYNTSAPVAWASGAALCIRAEVYHAAGGMDPVFFAHQEEIDLCWRVQLMGYRVYVCTSSVVYHVGGGTLPKGNARKVFLNYRNNLLMLAKNLPYASLWWKLPLRFLLDILSACKALLGGDKAYFTAVLRAHLAVCKWLFSGKKQNLFPPHRGNPHDGWYKGSIVYQYFVKGKRTFKEIIF